MISGINETTGQPLALTREPKKTLDSEDFMLLFIKQLQYQDPMNPIENNEMAMQMALFSQVDQLFKMNSHFESLLEVARSFDLATLTSFVGKGVKIEGDTGRVENGRFLGAEFELEEPVQQLEALIYDTQSRLVRRLELGALPAGKHILSWDAKDEKGETVPDGNYRIRIVNPEGRSQQEIPLMVYGRVTGAVIGEENKLVVNGKDMVDLESVQEILDPANL